MNIGIWIAVGILFLIVEIFAPGFIAFWFGIGAFLAAALSLVGLTNDIASQLAVWAVSSGVFLFLWHRVYKRGLAGAHEEQRTDETSGMAAGELVGKRGVALGDIVPSGSGRVRLHVPVYGLKMWDAKSDEHIESGSEVVVVGVEGTKLIVRRVS